MKRLLSLSLALLLTLTLLSIAPIPAKGPKPTEKAVVKFDGSDITSDEVTLDVFRPRTVIVYGDAALTFEQREGLWVNDTGYDFSGPWEEGSLSIWIYKSEEIEITYSFDKTKEFEDELRFRYQLNGPGEWDTEGNIVAVAGEPFTISEIFRERAGKGKGKGGGTVSITYGDPVWAKPLEFIITIEFIEV